MAHVLGVFIKDGQQMATFEMDSARTHDIPGGEARHTPHVKEFSRERIERLLTACEASGQDGSHFKMALNLMNILAAGHEMTSGPDSQAKPAPAPSFKPDGLKPTH